jgi:predicted CopG family antitoxin
MRILTPKKLKKMKDSKKSFGEAAKQLIKLKREKLDLERKKRNLQQALQQSERDRINAKINRS